MNPSHVCAVLRYALKTMKEWSGGPRHARRRRWQCGLLLLFFAGGAQAVTCTSQASTAWNVTTTWTGCTGGNGTPANTPGAADTAIIASGNAVTIPAGTFAAAALTVSGTLNVGGATFTVSGPTAVNGTLTHVTSTTGTKTYGAVTINGGGAWSNPINDAISINGNLNNAGTFSSGTGTYTFSGTAAQTLTGVSSVQNLTVSNTTAALTLANDLTVAGSIVLSGFGRIVTGANTLTMSSTAGTVTGAAVGGTRFVEGNFSKPFSASVLTQNFEVGTSSPTARYTPASISFAAVTVAGNITVSSTQGSHPALATSGLDTTTPSKLNRYWTITNSVASPVAFSNYSPTFTFVAADLDATTNPLGFISTQYVPPTPGAGVWSPTGDSANTATTIAIASETDFGDFAVGEVLGYNTALNRFNAYDPAPVTPANSIQGSIRTKQAGISFTLTIVHTNGAGTALANFTDPNVAVALYDGTTSTGTVTNNCNSSWTAISGASASAIANFSGGNSATATFTIPNSYKNVRVRITAPTTGDYGCAADRFAIRPQRLTVAATDATWSTAGNTRALTNTGATGGVVHKAGTASNSVPFTLTVTTFPSTATNYAGPFALKSGSPACINTLPAGCASGTLSLGTFAKIANVFVSSTANYSEVGAFTLDLEDQSFADVDISDTLPSVRTIPQTAAALAVGRFVPSHFALSIASTPQFQTFGVADLACTGTAPLRSFTYIGQTFGWVTWPQATVSAKNAANVTTTNYKGASLWKLVNSNATETYASVPATLNSAGKGTPTVVSNNDGTGTIASSSIGTFFFTRSTAQAPFDANISLSVNVQDATENIASQGIITAAAPLVMNGSGTGIAFDGGGTSNGKEQRFGRLRIENAYGSEQLARPVGLAAQFWNGSGYVNNPADNCTSLASANFPTLAYNPVGKFVTTVSGSGTLSAGVGRIVMTKPTSYTGKGSVSVSSGIGYLPGTGHVTFGIYRGGPLIYFREVY
jgi:hypothetical protein